jgi:hypothetical protein
MNTIQNSAVPEECFEPGHGWSYIDAPIGLLAGRIAGSLSHSNDITASA